MPSRSGKSRRLSGPQRRMLQAIADGVAIYLVIPMTWSHSGGATATWASLLRHRLTTPDEAITEQGREALRTGRYEVAHD